MTNMLEKRDYFVTGIGTEVGKTVISAILVNALEADYWKPVQCGDLDHSDTNKIQDWGLHAGGTCWPEVHRLSLPMSPHAAAEAESVDIKLPQFKMPKTKQSLIIEGAGGLQVPLNQRDSMIDLIAWLDLPVVLVARHYLGSINHTLLSIEALRRREIEIAALIFNGNEHPTTESIILQRTGIEKWYRIPDAEQVDRAFVENQAQGLREFMVNINPTHR